MKDFIKQFIVQINGSKFKGSGVLIKSYKEDFYVFTAKHNFAYKDDDKKNVQEIKLGNIQHDIKVNKIEVFHPYLQSLTIKISNVIFLDKDSLDFIILKIDKQESKGLDNLEQLKIFNDDFKKCVLAGYPKIRGDNSIGYFDCFYETKVDEDEARDDYRNTFEVYSTKPLYTHKNEEMETIVGISGGGVFVKGSDDNIYLAGIEIEYKGITNLVCISLRDIIDEVNEKLENDKIEVGGFSLYEKFGIDIEKLKLKSIKDEISKKNEYIIETLNKKKGEYDEYVFLKNPKNEYFKVINEKYKKVGNLAKAFLYNGIVFHENRDYNRATRHFKKAVKLDPNLEVYFSHSKFKRENLSKKQNKAIEKNIANLSSNNEEQLIENLIESINKDEDELESKILHLNHLLYRKIDLSLFSWSEEKNLIRSCTKLNFKQTFIKTREEIIKYTKKLSDFYLEKRDFQNARGQLKGLILKFQLEDDIEINKKLLNIYETSQNDFFGNSCIDRTLLIDELFELMNRFEFNSDENKKIQKMIKNISKVDDRYTKFTEKIESFEKDYDERIGSLSLGLKHISNNIVDKDVLMKIDFMLEHLTNSHGSLNIKLDRFEENRIEFKKNYQHILKIFKMIMKKGNKDLEESIKKISHQNSIDTRLMLNQLLRRIERGLNTIEIVDDTANFSNLDEKLKKIVADEIERFYVKTDNSKEIIDEKDKIIRLIQKRYGEHVLSLKKSLKSKNQEIIGLKIQLKESDKWLDEINRKYETLEINSNKFEQELLKLKRENKQLVDSISKSNSNTIDYVKFMKYKNEVESLKKLIKQLEIENKQIDELKKSIELSSETASNLLELEKTYKKEVEQIEKRFKKIKHNPKNEKRLRRISRQIKGFENKLEEIKKEKKGDTLITLRLVEADLEKIESIMNKKRLPIYRLYYLVRSILIGGILLGFLVIILLNYIYKF